MRTDNCRAQVVPRSRANYGQTVLAVNTGNAELPNDSAGRHTGRPLELPAWGRSTPVPRLNGDQHLTQAKLLDFLGRLGASARGPGACFITGGSSALLVGWRDTTIDVDLKFDPEPAGVFDAIPGLKRTLHINVELASPSDFLPPLKEWRERSRFIGKYGPLEVFHYDFVSQALSKIERGHAKDLLDVTEMLRRKLATPEELLAHAEAIRPQIKRYPAVDEESFMRRVKEFLEGRHDV